MAEVQENKNLILAVLFTFIGGLLSTLGLISMKYSHNKTQLDKNLNAYCNLIWPFGFLSLIVGSVSNVVALGYGNPILLSSSSSISIIINTILSILILKEKLHKSDVYAGILICTGSIAFIL